MIDKEGKERLGIRWLSLPPCKDVFVKPSSIGKSNGADRAIGCYIVFGYIYVGREKYIYPLK